MPELGSRRLIDEQHQKSPFISFYLSLLGRWQVYSKYLLSSLIFLMMGIMMENGEVIAGTGSVHHSVNHISPRPAMRSDGPQLFWESPPPIPSTLNCKLETAPQ